MPDQSTTAVQRDDAERGRLAVRAAVAAASALINDRVSPVPVDAATGLQLWFGLTAELIDAFGEEGVRAYFDTVLGFVAQNQGVISAMDKGADAAVLVHPPMCPCPKCNA